MTFQEKLNLKIETARKEKRAQQEVANEKLLENEAFINTKLNIVLKEEELNNLNTIIANLNNIEKFIANDGTKYGVKVFPINVFGIGLAQVMGIIHSSTNAFTDEMALEYSAITGISRVELQEAAHYMGNPAYCTKTGDIVEAVPYDYGELKPLLRSIAMTLGLNAFDVRLIDKNLLDLWFMKENLKAEKKANEILKMESLTNSTGQFTLED